MKEKIQSVLNQLIGLPLWTAGRAGTLEWLHFGDKVTVLDHKNREKTVGTYAIHLQCAWHIASPEGIIIGSTDVFYPDDESLAYDRDINWADGNANRRDVRTLQLFPDENQAFFVSSVTVDPYGGFCLGFANGMRLQVFINDSLPREHWRFFEPPTEGHHYVQEGNTFE